MPCRFLQMDFKRTRPTGAGHSQRRYQLPLSRNVVIIVQNELLQVFLRRTELSKSNQASRKLRCPIP